ncbi:hypothetical protein [Succinimonas sp.]|uniref:hypothetical protein n=1 Tax=Succinimonas sp. TaxID=1936151 RepID=UPI002E8D213E|nr:hypothetical protein [Succinimonas sp.]
MKLLTVVAGTAFLFLLSGCQPKVDCASEDTYKSTLKEVIAEIRKQNPQDADDVEKFLKVKGMLTFSSGIDRDICGRNADGLNSYAHNYVKDQIDSAKKQVKDSLDQGLKATQDALDNAFGDKKE